MPPTAAENRKQWRLQNPEKVKESKRKYKSKAEYKMVHYCLCGGQYTLATKSKHVKSDMHKVWQLINPAEETKQNFVGYFGVVVFN